MLNRRLLRSKVVQALYAISLADDSNRLLAYDEIAEKYQPDLNSMEPQNLPQLEGFRRLAVLSFDELIKNGTPEDDAGVPKEVVATAKNAYLRYQNANKTDRKNIISRVVSDTADIYSHVLLALQFLTDLAHLARMERNREHHNMDDPIPLDSGLDENVVIQTLQNHDPFREEVIQRGLSWTNDFEVVQRTYREIVRQDPEYRIYCESGIHSLEEDQEMAQHIVRNLIFKNQLFIDYMEDRDLYWEDHKELVRGMVIRSLKSVTGAGQIVLAPFSNDWEEDRSFMLDMIHKTLDDEEEYEKTLKSQLMNWDNERLAKVDMIILKAALAEMIHFPGIPVKVTINEYIETAKRYSTLQSGKFVNGLLDKLSEKLLSEKVIRKSGKGLIDNR